MGPAYTNLEPKHYDYLERFLDATKANLFFAKAVVMVEGDAENILLPTIAECLGRPLYQYGVSIVNVGSTAFLHYAKVFSRKDGQKMGIKAAIITDLDVKPEEEQKGKQLTEIEDEKRRLIKPLSSDMQRMALRLLFLIIGLWSMRFLYLALHFNF